MPENNNNAGAGAAGAGEGAGGAAAGAGAGEGAGADKGNQNGAMPEGVIEKDGVQYIRKDSYEVVAGKLRDKTEAEKAREVEATKAREAEMVKKGEFEKLAKSKEEEANTYKQKFETTVKQNALIVEALKLGAIDTDAIVKLADMTQVKLSEDGSVDAGSVAKVVEELKTGKAYLFGAAPATTAIGNAGGGAPAGGGQVVRSFKRSELQNHAFYKANEKEILAAYAQGKIVDDIDGVK